MSLAEAVAAHVHDGDTVALEGFTHLIPFAAGHEIIRQGRRDLHLVRMTPDIVYDQLIGAGCARKLVFSWGGNPGVGSLHRFRDAVESGWPAPLDLDEHSHAGMANRYVAGASGIPFAVLRGYVGTRPRRAETETIKPIICPFTGEQLTAVPRPHPGRDDRPRPARRPEPATRADVGHRLGVQKEAVLARDVRLSPSRWSRRRSSTRAWCGAAARLGRDGRCPRSGRCPRRRTPRGYDDCDNDYYQAWDAISRSRESFGPWVAAQRARPPQGEHGVRNNGQAWSADEDDDRRCCP